MSILDNKILQISVKNVKEKLRHWQFLFFSLGLPIMFTLMFYFILGTEEDPSGRTGFDYGFSGMVIYAVGIGTMNAAIMFAGEKGSGMLTRLDTMPTGRKNIFLGTLISETFFLMLQIIIMFIIGYGFLGLYFVNPLVLFIAFLVTILFGISSVGMGIMIASVSKNVEIANAFSLMVYMILIFISGSLMPFESVIVYFTPPYWAKQLYLQLTVMGDGFNDNLYSSSLIGAGAKAIPITLLGGLLIIVAYTVIFVILGILLFQKKTKF